MIDLIKSWGSPIVVDGKAAIDKKKATEAVTFYVDLLTKHKVAPASAPNDGYRQIMEAFKTGQTAMVWHHTGSLTEIQAALKPEQFGTLPMPAGPAATSPASPICSTRCRTRRGSTRTSPGSPSGPSPSRGSRSWRRRAISRPLQGRGRRAHRRKSVYAAAVETTKFGRLPPTFVGVAGWSETVVLPEFQKALVKRATPEQAVDAMIQGLEAALK